jgi:hypothetical protein
MWSATQDRRSGVGKVPGISASLVGGSRELTPQDNHGGPRADAIFARQGRVEGLNGPRGVPTIRPLPGNLVLNKSRCAVMKA